MEAVLEQLVRSPKLKLYVDELAQTLDREQTARIRFRDSLHAGGNRRVEFINGEEVEHMHVRDIHTTTVSRLETLLGTYAKVRGLGAVRSEQSLVGLTRNDYLPDIAYWTPEKASAFASDQAIYPIPDFACEVLSPSTESRDRGVKFEDYAAHGVSEYWLVDPDQQTIEQYLLRDGNYDLACKVRNGTIASEVIEGFEMPVAAAFDDDANLQALWALAPRG